MAWRLNNVTSNVYIPFHETPNFKIIYPNGWASRCDIWDLAKLKPFQMRITHMYRYIDAIEIDFDRKTRMLNDRNWFSSALKPMLILREHY